MRDDGARVRGRQKNKLNGLVSREYAFERRILKANVEGSLWRKI
jgi:hypothetical protein